MTKKVEIRLLNTELKEIANLPIFNRKIKNEYWYIVSPQIAFW